MPKKTKSFINLLPQEEFEASLLGRFLRWAMGTFRIIVIITEMIVMGAFLSRFWLDAQNSDLSDSIRIKSAQITAQKDFEDEFRNAQNKLNIFKAISSDIAGTSRIDSISGTIPPEVSLSSVSIMGSVAAIKGSSSSEIGIAQFISNLKKVAGFKKVDLGEVSSSEENPNLTLFTVKISY